MQLVALCIDEVAHDGDIFLWVLGCECGFMHLVLNAWGEANNAVQCADIGKVHKVRKIGAESPLLRKQCRVPVAPCLMSEAKDSDLNPRGPQRPLGDWNLSSHAREHI